ncbi:hypothetical protein B0H19DRAFT_1277189 [Mycena capillaripes]|nr:hypothetical protein B0H19DRAFT_1277189 [Mycena capillaripes]
MDVSALGCFHRSVCFIPFDSNVVPLGGLKWFLHDDLRNKVFLVAIGTLEDCWGTKALPSLTAGELVNVCVCMHIVVEHMVCPSVNPRFLADSHVFAKYYAARVRQNELIVVFTRYNVPAESSWMFYLISVLLHVVGFEGDDGPVERGFSPLEMAKSEADFLLRRATDCFFLQRSMKKPVETVHLGAAVKSND